MALVVADRVLETATSPGTGAVSLLGAVSGYVSFLTGVGNGNTTYYTIADQSGANWEVGLGTYNSTGSVLTRTTPIAGSAATPVNFVSGTQNVFVTQLAEKAVYLDASGNTYAPKLGAATASTGAFTTLEATGVFTASAGTSALPSIVTSSGSTSGLYSSTANVLGIAISAASVGTFTATGLNGMAVGATTTSTGAFTTLSASSTVSGTGFSTYLASPPAIGGTTAAAGSFTTLSASSTVSGTGFSTYLASPPAIGGTAAAAGNFTNSQITSLGVGTAASGTTGEIRATNNVTAYYSSDRKFKENIEDIPNALKIVDAIGGKLFDWTDAYLNAHGGEDDYFLHKHNFGVIAQDVQAVFPRAVRIRPDGSLAVDYDKLIALAFAAIKELKRELNK